MSKFIFILIITLNSFNLLASDYLIVGNLKEVKHLSIYPESISNSSEDIKIIEVHKPHWHLYELKILKVIHGKLKKDKIIVAYEHWSGIHEEDTHILRISTINDEGLANYTGAKYLVSERIDEDKTLCVSEKAFSLFKNTDYWDGDDDEPLFEDYGKKCFYKHSLLAE